jgi:ABC-2 type transport system permease protein
MGQGLTGNAASFLIFTLITLAVSLLVYKLLAGTFLHLATTSGKTKKKVYTGGPMKTASASKALMRKELRHYRGSSTYILNSSMGTLFMIGAACFLFIRQGWIRAEIGAVFEYYPEMTVLIACALLMFLTGSNELTAPAISLEGRSIWILQSMPVDPFKVLWSKIKLHLVMTLPPAALVMAAVFVVIRPRPALMLLIVLVTVLNILFDAVFGLLVNLRLPHLEWNDEITAIKQSGAAILSLLGNWALLFVLAVIYAIIGRILGPVIYLILAAIVLAGVCTGMLVWLKKKGAAKFAVL